MLPLRSPIRKRSSRLPFRQPLWDDQHPDFLRIDAQLPQDHHARWLLDAVSRLNLEPLRRAYANRGSLAYPPELLLPFVLFMYSKKEISPAAWATQVHENSAAQWLLRGLQPRRSALYAFRDRTEPFLDDWHKQLLDWARAAQVTAARCGSLDGSFVAALSSRHRLLNRRLLDGRLLLLCLAVWLDQHQTEAAQTAIGLLLGRAALLPADGLLSLLLALLLLALLLCCEQPAAVRNDLLPGWLGHSVVGRKRMLKRYEKAQQRLAERLQPYQNKKRLSKKDTQAIKRAKINPSDVEAALGWDKVGTYRPLYNLQVVKATDAMLVLAWELFSKNNDEGLLKPMMHKTTEQLGQHLEQVIVDGGYVSIGDLLDCEQRNITVYAPPAKEDRPKAVPAAPLPQENSSVAALPSSPSAAQQSPASVAAVGPTEAARLVGSAGQRPEVVKKYAKEMFRYDLEQQVYHCPAGKVLPEVFRTTEERQGGLALQVLVHRAAAADCRECAQKEHCTQGKQGRVVKRYEGEEVLERLRQRMRQPASKKIYQQRCQTVEQGYAELKEHRGLRMFRCFGRKRARAQAGLTILASNALSIVRVLRRREGEVAPPSRNEKQPS
jgi:transposase